MENKNVILSMWLMFFSFFFLIYAVSYCDLGDKVSSYKYSSSEEYEEVTKGIEFIKNMPIQFNIINKYFSNMNNLEDKEKEEILISYALKNNYKVFDCSDNVSNSLCIKKEDLNSKELLAKFNLMTKINREDFDVYLDNYGMSKVSTNAELDYYKINLDTLANEYTTYSKFSHFIQENDLYIFYFYQGYYEGNCQENTKLELFDFISGKPVYENICSTNHTFVKEPSIEVENLQLYKYELKKDKDNNFYLHAYNPVKKKNTKT